MGSVCIWTGGDRNVLNPFDRLHGYPAAVGETDHPWTVNETGKNHRVIVVPDATRRDLIYIRQAHERMVETRPGHFERDSIGRCAFRVDREFADYCRDREHFVTVMSMEEFEAHLVCAKSGPTRYLTRDEKKTWYRAHKKRFDTFLLVTTAYARPN